MEIKKLIKKNSVHLKKLFFLDSGDLSKIIISNNWKISDTKYKYFCEYINNGVIQPLCVILTQMRGYFKYFDDGGKITDDKEVYKKYNEIWEVVKKILKLKFTVSPVRDDKYIIAKLKIFKNVNITTFTNNVIPEENTHYTCISAIDISSVLKIDKKAYPQAYLEQCKYKLKKRKRSRYIDHLKIIDYDSENDSDSLVMLKLEVKKELKMLNYLDNHLDDL